VRTHKTERPEGHQGKGRGRKKGKRGKTHLDAVVFLTLNRLLPRVELLALVDVLGAGTVHRSGSAGYSDRGRKREDALAAHAEWSHQADDLLLVLRHLPPRDFAAMRIKGSALRWREGKKGKSTHLGSKSGGKYCRTTGVIPLASGHRSGQMEKTHLVQHLTFRHVGLFNEGEGEEEGG
jgi:hypothetical protein